MTLPAPPSPAEPAIPSDDSPWLLWGPYLAERQWGTLREDSAGEGDFWSAFPYEQSHARARFDRREHRRNRLAGEAREGAVVFTGRSIPAAVLEVTKCAHRVLLRVGQSALIFLHRFGCVRSGPTVGAEPLRPGLPM